MKKKKYVFLVLGIFLLIGIGYAALSANLKINGTSGVKSNKWIIYFDNVQNEKGRIISKATINEDKTEVAFTIELKEPGDLYEFNVDTVNDGTIDAMIESVETEDLPEKYEDLVTFKVTYSDGTELKECDELNAETRRNLRVYVLYRDDINSNDLPEEDENISLKFKINYTQKGVCTTRNTLNIDPNGGIYNNSDKVTSVLVDKNSTYEVTVPTRSGFIFKGWSLEDGTSLEKDEATGKTTVNIGESNVTIKAVWEVDTTDYVARIENTYYETIQKAIDAAQAGDVIHLLKSTTESPTNNKNVTLNLENFTVTGTLTNTVDGNITLINGEINSNEIALVNNGTVTLGIKDGNYEIDNIRIVGITVGLDQNKNFYFYDGFLQGLTGIEGGCNGKEDGYYIYVDSIKIDNIEYQKVYLIDHPDGVAMTINGEEFYFFSLQYAVADTDNLHPTVYITKDFESSAEVIVDENQILVLDMNGHTLTYGAQLTNNGTLTVKDSKNKTGNFKIAESIINNKDLTIEDVVITQTTNNNNIDNNGNITVENSNITALSGAALNNNSASNITFDGNTTLTSTGYAFINNTTGTTKLRGGNISSIKQEAGTLEIENVALSPNKTNAIYQTGGTLEIKDGTYSTTYQTLLSKTSGDLIISNGTFTTNYDYTYSGTILDVDGGTTTIKNGTFTTNFSQEYYNNTSIYGYLINSHYSETINIKNGTYKSNRGQIFGPYIKDGGFTIDDGTFTTTNNSIISPTSDYLITINGGTFKSENAITLKLGAATINGGIFTSTNNNALYINSNTVTINGGTFISENSTAIYITKVDHWTGTLILKSGNIKGKKYGIQTTDNAVLKIGENGEAYNINTPVIEGELTGLYIGGTNTEYYDGILKSKGNPYYGSFTTLRDGYFVDSGTEEREENEIYNTAFLNIQPNFVKTDDGEEFNDMTKAINHIETTGTITLLNDTNYAKDFTIPSGKTIIFDLDGNNFNLTKTFNNNGILTIKDTKDTGKMTSLAQYMVKNNYQATLNIINGNYEGNTVIYNNTGTTNITNGTFKSTANNGSVVNNYIGTLTVDNMNATGNTIISTYRGTATINNGTTTGKAVQASGKGTVTINNLTATNENSEVLNCTDRNDMVFTINDGTYTSTKERTLNNFCNANINGGTFISTNSSAIANSTTLNISGGTIKSLTKSAVMNYCDSNHHPYMTITDGTIIGKTYGIENNGYYPTDLTIGKKDNEIDISKPVIIGEQYGIYYQNQNSNINFYDGILKGKNGGYSATISDLETKSCLEESTEELDGETYKNAYLINQQNFLETNDGEEFNSLQDAIDYITTTGSIKLLKTVSTTDSAEIPSGKDITIDFNSYTYNTSKTLVNKGTLTLTDNNPVDNQITGGIINNSSKLINTNNNLTIEKGNYRGIKYLVEQTDGTLVINDGSFTNSSSDMVDIFKTGGVTTINGGYFESTASSSVKAYRATLYLTNGTTNINNGTFANTIFPSVEANKERVTINDGNFLSSLSYSSYARLVVSDNSIAEIYGGTFTGNGHAAISNYADTTIYGGTFTSNNLDIAAINNRQNLTINGGTITGNKYGISNNGTSNILGGTIFGKTYGVYQTGGTLNLGENNGRIDIASPNITGTSYGIYISGGIANFYDGVLKGKTGSYNGTFNVLATDTQEKTENETIDDEVYIATYLIKQTEVIQNNRTSKKYKDINEAFGEAIENDTLTLIDNASSYDQITIPDKNLTIDLNNYTLTANKKIMNSGTTTITSSNTNTKGRIETSASLILLTNDNNLTINNIELVSTGTENEVLLNSDSKSVTISDCNITSNNGKIKNLGSMEINDSNINIYNAISNEGGTLEINGTDVNSIRGAVYNYNGTYELTSDKLYSDYSAPTIVSNSDDNVSLTKSTIQNCELETRNNYYTAVDNRKLELDLINTNTKGKIENTGTININQGSVYNYIINNNIMNIQNVSLKGQIINSSRLVINDSDLEIILADSYNRNYNGIENTGTLTLNNFDMDISNRYSTYNFYGINNSGTLNYNSSDMVISNSTTSYGIYNIGKLNMLGGTIDIKNTINAYGVYQYTGEMIFGHLEGTGINANPSTTSPLVQAVGSSQGIGVKRVNGTFRYFDGKFIGSTNAKPEAPTQIEEPDYEVTYGTDENGYNYCILTYLENH